MTTITLLAQAGELMESLKPYGIAGICLGFFMMRDIWREKQRDLEMKELRAAVADCAGAMNHLTKAITTEVLTRPNLQPRTAADMRELQEMVSKGG